MTIDSEREMTLYTLEWYKALKDKNDLDLNVLELLIDVEHTVNKLECSKQKDFIHTLYLSNNDIHTIEDASNILGYSKQWGYRLHNKAVDEITLNLDFSSYKL